MSAVDVDDVIRRVDIGGGIATVYRCVSHEGEMRPFARSSALRHMERAKVALELKRLNAATLWLKCAATQIALVSDSWMPSFCETWLALVVRLAEQRVQVQP